jgi:pimeloyl-ACP methyl ester carboxylesterase
VLAYLRPRVGRMLAPDAPAHGFSGLAGPLSVDHAYAGLSQLLLRELDRPAVLFGNSMGGAFAIRFALEHPDRVRGLFLSSPAGAAVDAQDFASLRDHFRVVGLATPAAWSTASPTSPTGSTPWSPPTSCGSSAAAPCATSSSPSSPATCSPRSSSPSSAPDPPRVGPLRARPPAASLEFFRRALPSHATFEEPDDFGHCPYMDKPYALAAKIAEFTRARADT